jgi:hypothetical protein
MVMGGGDDGCRWWMVVDDGFERFIASRYFLVMW